MEDVVIVGGGPAGLTAAKTLAESGISPLLLEASPEFGHKACGELMAENLYGFSVSNFLTKGVVERVHEEIAIRFYDETFVVSRRGGRGLISKLRIPTRLLFINRKKFERGLAAKARASGATIKMGVRVFKIERGSDFLVINDEIRTKLLVGADGALSIVRRFLGLEPRDLAFAMSGRVKINSLAEEWRNLELPMLIVDPGKIADRGYGWIFPGRTEANVGVGIFEGHERFVRGLWKTFERTLGIEDRGEEPETRGAFIPLSLSRKTWVDNVLLVGDAAGMVDPLTGGGLNGALLSGWLAARVCEEAVRKNETKGTLKKYEERWKSHFLTSYLKSKLLSRLFYSFFINRKKLTSWITRHPILGGSYSSPNPHTHKS